MFINLLKYTRMQNMASTLFKNFVGEDRSQPEINILNITVLKKIAPLGPLVYKTPQLFLFVCCFSIENCINGNFVQKMCIFPIQEAKMFFF